MFRYIYKPDTIYSYFENSNILYIGCNNNYITILLKNNKMYTIDNKKVILINDDYIWKKFNSNNLVIRYELSSFDDNRPKLEEETVILLNF